jgi:branched-chain amino acid transport system ATP-binding protein
VTLLAVSGLTVRFAGVVALANVSIEFAAGAIYGLIGPNGAGKTTLINAVSGLAAPSQGSIRFEGRDITRLPPHAIARRGIGRTFQHAETFADRTVHANVMAGFDHRMARGFWHDFAGTPAKRRAERETARLADAQLRRFGIAAYRDELAGDLPFGVLKRIDLARAMALEPRLLLLDEPTSGMNESEAHDTVSICRALAKERGITLVVVEHNMRVIMAMADRITVLHHGEKIAEAAPEAVQRDRLVIDTYLGRETGDA